MTSQCLFICMYHNILVSIVPSSYLNELTTLPLAAKWKQLGTQLEVPVYKLFEIQENNSNKPYFAQSCLTDVFVWWLRNGSATFNVLAKALHSLEVHEAEKLLCPVHGK